LISLENLALLLPFSVLPDKEQKAVFNMFSYEKVFKDTVLIEQEITKVEKFYTLCSGHCYYYFEDRHATILEGWLNPGDSFGGLAILFNDTIAIRSLKILEDSIFVTLDADYFLGLCKNYTAFQEDFTNKLGKCMLNKGFAGIMARQIRDKEFSLPFFNRPISKILTRNFPRCPAATTIADAARSMSREGASAMLVTGDNNTLVGIVTDADFKHKVATGTHQLSEPVGTVTSAPLLSIPANSQVFEAFLALQKNDKRHLAVMEQNGEVTAIISQKDLIAAQAGSAYLLIKTALAARSMLEIENIHEKLEHMLIEPLKNGAHAEFFTRLISACSDAVIDRVITFSIEQIGPPPCRFAFLTMGSEGREEQTLISDQDNAIVFEDTEHPQQTKEYFDELATLICDELHVAGYAYCKGNNMAKVSKWCQPLSQWRNYFNTWIKDSSPENLLKSSIFFDFRGVYGDTALVDDLKRFLFNAVKLWPGFLRDLAENALYFKPPLGFFGKLLVETAGEQKGLLDLKSAMQPIVDFARIYALKFGISQTNTLTRLFLVSNRQALTKKDYLDIVRGYEFMMQLRFQRQITGIKNERKHLDNHVNPENLASIDLLLLKETFKVIEELQKTISIEFTGSV
jgi:CBS domain-containing protein